MGSVWLTDLDAAVKSTGVDYVVFDNYWRTRSRSSGGYDKLLAIGGHHDATPPGSSDSGAERYCWVTSSAKPIGALRLRRSGVVVIGAAGATNTQGLGGPLKCSRGTVPLNGGNKNMLSIEAGNNGTGERWPKVQIEAYLALVAGLAKWYGLSINDYFGHYGYTKPSCEGRKVDPAGPTPDYPQLGGVEGRKIWSDANFRSYASGVKPPTPTPPKPTPTPPSGDFAWMASLPTIKKGDSGAYVERMQHLLAAAGFMDPANTSNYDGVWGNGTESAKVKFDNAHGLTPSPPSDCGAKSWESLLTGRKW